MNPERLLAHFETISEASDAVARLRRFILDLAVRGKLVEQDPEDEPVDLLLDEIKSRMKMLRLKHAFSIIDPLEIPFDKPSGWTWCRLGEVCEKTGSGSTPRGGKDVYKSSGVPFLRSQNIYNEGLRLDDVAFIDVQTHERMAGTRVLPCDLLLNITGGSIGRCAKVPLNFGEANVSQHVAIIRVAARGTEEFFHSLILSPYFQGFVDKSQTGAGRGGLPKNRMDAIPIPLPPLAEQHRIVAKVDELMVLCDQLEAARQQRDQGRERLVAATLQRLNQPSEDPASFRNDARFALQVLPSLTTTPAQIKQLRQTILNLAVRGKLVEQDPEDEPAEELLKAISLDFSRSKGRRTAASSSSVIATEGSFEVPDSWVWILLGGIGDWGSGSTPPRGRHEYYGGDISWFKSGELNDNKCLSDSEEKITRLALEQCSFRQNKPGDVLIAMYGATIGRLAILAEEGVTNQAVCACTPYWGIDAEYLFLFLLAKRDDFRLASEGGAQPNISKVKIVNTAIPLPPLAEQHRIVARVDELMALCDQLEQRLSQADQQRRRLLEAVLEEALKEPEPTLESMTA